MPAPILLFDAQAHLGLATFASAEAQAAAIADDIAYNAHDIDDGLRAGLFDIADLRDVPFLRELVDEIERLHPGLERVRVIHEISRRVITRLIEDVIGASLARIEARQPRSADDVRGAGEVTVSFSPAFRRRGPGAQGFPVSAHVPAPARHEGAARGGGRGRGPVRAVCRELGPDAAGVGPCRRRPRRARPRLRIVCDYIAGMTDRYAVSEHVRLTGGRRRW